MASVSTRSVKRQTFFASISRELLDKIMKKVPIQVLLRWRLVCKRWNQAIMSKQWISETNERSLISIPLLMNCTWTSVTPVALLALKGNHKFSNWYKIDIDLAAFSDLYQSCRNQHLQCFESLRCTTAGSLGLMFFTRYCSAHFDSDLSVIVYNPITKEFRPLEMPAIPLEYEHMKGRRRLVGVIVDKSNLHYTLVFNTVTSLYDQTFEFYFIYDSQTRTWKFKTFSIPPFHHISSKVVSNGSLYFLYMSSVTHSPENMTMSTLFEPNLGVYEAESDTWRRVEESLMPKHARAPYFPQLVQHKGNVFYVVVSRSDVMHQTGEKGQIPLKTWCFFKLNQAASSTSDLWTKVREMPRNVFEAFSVYTREYYDEETGRHDVRCEGQGDFIYFYSVKPSTKFRLPQSNSAGRPRVIDGVVLLHNFEKDEWFFLKKYSPFETADISRSSVYKLESFRPSFIDV